MNLKRLIALIGEDKVNAIKKSNVLILGLGGVGGYTVESLVRSGLGKITLVDGDLIESSNINRQIITLKNNINKYKTKEFYKRIKKINPECSVTLINKMIKESSMHLIFAQDYDYIVDACDDVNVKKILIKECFKRKIKIISCMGTAKRIDATKIKIDKLSNITGDPLAKSVKKGLTEEEKEYTYSIYSTEEAIKINELGSTSYVPAVAGLFITDYIINDIIKKN